MICQIRNFLAGVSASSGKTRCPEHKNCKKKRKSKLDLIPPHSSMLPPFKIGHQPSLSHGGDFSSYVTFTKKRLRQRITTYPLGSTLMQAFLSIFFFAAKPCPQHQKHALTMMTIHHFRRRSSNELVGRPPLLPKDAHPPPKTLLYAAHQCSLGRGSLEAADLDTTTTRKIDNSLLCHALSLQHLLKPLPVSASNTNIRKCHRWCVTALLASRSHCTGLQTFCDYVFN